MTGVVFGPGSILQGRYARVVALGAGAAIPPGEWFVGGAFTINAPAASGTGTTAIACAGGFCVSDGTNATITAAGNVTQLGGGNNAPWPWPAPPT